MGNFFCFNGKLYKQNTPLITCDNRALKFGDGMFETMKMVNGKMILKEYHFERLFKGLRTLQFEIPGYFTHSFLEKEINSLAKKNKIIYTPSLKQACIAGIIRRWLIESIKNDGLSIKEKSISIEEIKQADEIFLTNSIYDVRWVKQFQNVQYTNKLTKTIYASLAKALYS